MLLAASLSWRWASALIDNVAAVHDGLGFAALSSWCRQP